LAQAILGNDLNRLQEVLRLRHHQRDELKRQKEEELVSRLYDDYCFFTCQGFKFNCTMTGRFASNPLELFNFIPCALPSLC